MPHAFLTALLEASEAGIINLPLLTDLHWCQIIGSGKNAKLNVRLGPARELHRGKRRPVAKPPHPKVDGSKRNAGEAKSSRSVRERFCIRTDRSHFGEYDDSTERIADDALDHSAGSLCRARGEGHRKSQQRHRNPGAHPAKARRV